MRDVRGIRGRASREYPDPDAQRAFDRTVTHHHARLMLANSGSSRPLPGMEAVVRKGDIRCFPARGGLRRDDQFYERGKLMGAGDVLHDTSRRREGHSHRAREARIGRVGFPTHKVLAVTQAGNERNHRGEDLRTNPSGVGRAVP
jgi:hypothetical protein